MPDMGSTTAASGNWPSETWGAPPEASMPMPTQVLEWHALPGHMTLAARLRLVFALRAGH